MEYHRTKDILYGKHLLGHHNIKNALVYTHLINVESDEWVCKVASNVQEAVMLVEAGFEYITSLRERRFFEIESDYGVLLSRGMKWRRRGGGEKEILSQTGTYWSYL
jgi:hypothetical protein